MGENMKGYRRNAIKEWKNGGKSTILTRRRRRKERELNDRKHKE
jgi:hypothetical protein